MRRNKSPQIVGAMEASKVNRRKHFTRYENQIQFDRSLLPTPAKYYSGEFPGMKIKTEWVKVHCCFHENDTSPSLNLNMVNGNYRCFACGEKGGDIITFHRRRYKKSFKQTLIALGVYHG